MEAALLAIVTSSLLADGLASTPLYAFPNDFGLYPVGRTLGDRPVVLRNGTSDKLYYSPRGLAGDGATRELLHQSSRMLLVTSWQRSSQPVVVPGHETTLGRLGTRPPVVSILSPEQFARQSKGLSVIAELEPEGDGLKVVKAYFTPLTPYVIFLPAPAPVQITPPPSTALSTAHSHSQVPAPAAATPYDPLASPLPPPYSIPSGFGAAPPFA